MPHGMLHPSALSSCSTCPNRIKLLFLVAKPLASNPHYSPSSTVSIRFNVNSHIYYSSPVFSHHLQQPHLTAMYQPTSYHLYTPNPFPIATGSSYSMHI